MLWLKTAQEVTKAANKAKMVLTIKGSNGNEEAFKLASFMTVRAKMCGAKMK